ncbi:MAG: hypothetical protein Q7R98_03275 [Candidatus Jorgensenbacteria bacterium]|nr:hypothetical protein [Candidatus Jorgensenbacteria bacterium]
MSRLSKQILYGLLYLVILFFVVSVAYKIVLAPSPAANPAVTVRLPAASNADALRVSRGPEVLGMQSGKAVVLFEVANPSADYHKHFSYALSVYGVSGYVIESVSGNGRVLASQKEYIVDNGITTLVSDISRVAVSFSNITTEAAKDVILPNITLSREPMTIVENDAIKVTGYIRNESSLAAGTTKLVAILRNAFGDDVFASKTIIGNLAPFEERTFVILFPRDSGILKEADATSTQVFVYEE